MRLLPQPTRSNSQLKHPRATPGPAEHGPCLWGRQFYRPRGSPSFSASSLAFLMPFLGGVQSLGTFSLSHHHDLFIPAWIFYRWGHFGQKDTVIELCLPERTELNAGYGDRLGLSWVCPHCALFAGGESVSFFSRWLGPIIFLFLHIPSGLWPWAWKISGGFSKIKARLRFLPFCLQLHLTGKKRSHGGCSLPLRPLCHDFMCLVRVRGHRPPNDWIF